MICFYLGEAWRGGGSAGVAERSAGGELEAGGGVGGSAGSVVAYVEAGVHVAEGDLARGIYFELGVFLGKI